MTKGDKGTLVEDGKTGRRTDNTQVFVFPDNMTSENRQHRQCKHCKLAIIQVVIVVNVTVFVFAVAVVFVTLKHAVSHIGYFLFYAVSWHLISFTCFTIHS